ncbi:MAG: LysE family transporter [Microlunatus sp.]|nr:LysE family transporter [Microlunatus sp.]
MPQALDALRLAGAIVLVWLAVKMINSVRRPAGSVTSDLTHPYRRGFIVDVSNPKAPIFFGAVLPQFIGHGARIMINTAILGLTVVLVSGVFWLLVAAVAGAVGFGRSAAAGRIVSVVSGVVLITVAFGLLLPALDHLRAS